MSPVLAGGGQNPFIIGRGPQNGSECSRLWVLKESLQLGGRDGAEDVVPIPRFGAPFVTCEPSLKHCTIAKTGRLYE